MNFPGHARTSVETPPVGCGMPLPTEPYASSLLDVQLPILTRSITYLRVLLQEGIVDLDLASSVIVLDPGLAYRVLQLANRDLPDDRDRIWQLPLAIVTAGRANIEDMLEQSALHESVDSDKWVLRSLVTEAVLRACLAHALARELAPCSPRKCFLSGLLFELPALVSLGVPARLDSHALLLSDMCHSLPVTIVRAALAEFASQHGPTDPAVAVVSIAQELLLVRRLANPQLLLDELADSWLWRAWPDMPVLQRSQLLQHCCGLAQWAAKNLYELNPWDFMTQLENFAPCE